MPPRLLPPDEALPHRLAPAVRLGEVVALPTDTTYALVTALESAKGVARLIEMRRLGPDRPVTLLLGGLDEIARWAKVETPAFREIRRLAPGPYTFLLPATRDYEKATGTKRKVVGVRIPSHDFLRKLAREVGGPLASASAIRFDAPPDALPQERYITEAEELALVYPGVAAIVDFGPVFPEASTVLDLTAGDAVVVRRGAGKV